jgi:hypothetical protein
MTLGIKHLGFSWFPEGERRSRNIPVNTAENSTVKTLHVKLSASLFCTPPWGICSRQLECSVMAALSATEQWYTWLQLVPWDPLKTELYFAGDILVSVNTSTLTFHGLHGERCPDVGIHSRPAFNVAVTLQQTVTLCETTLIGSIFKEETEETSMLRSSACSHVRNVHYSIDNTNAIVNTYTRIFVAINTCSCKLR